VNGLYEVTDEVSGGMPVYKKQGAEMWLEWNKKKQQWISRVTASKGEASEAGTAYVGCTSTNVLPVNSPVGTWKILVDGAWVAQPAIRCAATPSLLFYGSTGSNSSGLNGIYVATDEISGDMPVYRKENGSSMWLEYHAGNSQWIARVTSSKGQNSSGGTAYIPCTAGLLPDKATAGAWKVLVDGEWTAQSSVVVCPAL